MEIDAARELALRLMRQHLLGRGYKFKFDNCVTRFGSCSYGRRLITLSQPLTLLNEEDHVRNTILHEIAHALTPGAHHGPKWKAKCLEIGARPERCFSDEVVKPKCKYWAACRVCSKVWYRHRKGDGFQSCCRQWLEFEEYKTLTIVFDLESVER